MKLYGEISKTEKQDDGTIKVWGYASTEATDCDGEVVTADAMKAALPDYMKFGAVREMHDSKSAAGTAIEAKVEDDGRTFFGAHVVDPIAVKKVETGVYKGFSIGGKVTSRDELKKTTITGLSLREISLVDRPANPGAIFTMFKADGAIAEDAVDDLAELLNKGTVSAARLLELAKAEIEKPAVEPAKPADPATPPSDTTKTAPAAASPAADGAETDKAAATDDVKKGMYTVQDFANVLSWLGCIASDAGFEAQLEGDSSKVPAALRAWLAQGIEIFKAMAAEEAAEMLASLAPAAPVVEVVELSAKVDDLTKAAKASEDALAKVAGELDLAKAAVASLTTERDELQKRNDTLAAMPAPGKALLKAIGKGDDVAPAGTEQNDVEKVTRLDGTESEVATLIKAAQRVPLMVR